MRRSLKTGIAIVLIILAIGAIYTPSPWQEQTMRYVGNFVNSYNTEVQIYQAFQSNFTTYKPNFQLWHDVGQNFKVLVVNNNPNDSNTVGFIFEQISGNQPQVEIDSKDTVLSLFETPPITQGGQKYGFGISPIYTHYGNAFVYYSVNFPEYANYSPIVWVTSRACVTNWANGENSKGAADALYQADIAHSKPPGSVVNRTYPGPMPFTCTIDTSGEGFDPVHNLVANAENSAVFLFTNPIWLGAFTVIPVLVALVVFLVKKSDYFKPPTRARRGRVKKN